MILGGAFASPFFLRYGLRLCAMNFVKLAPVKFAYVTENHYISIAK